LRTACRLDQNREGAAKGTRLLRRERNDGVVIVARKVAAQLLRGHERESAQVRVIRNC